MMSLLVLGFVIGMKHALEADHVAAVSSLIVRSPSAGNAMRQGMAWGLGHSLTLFAFGSAVLVLDTVMPARLADALELAVGVMLVLLGADVLHRFWSQRVHFHVHRHRDGTRHVHAHSHHGEHPTQHDADLHEHAHPHGFPYRALFVGLMHGMAGSAALILLTLETVRTPVTGLLYMALFGAGSMAGMGVLTAAIAVPMHHSERRLGRIHDALQVVTGLATVVLGGTIFYRFAL